MRWNMRDVFISHSSENAEIAEQLCGLLQKIGLPSEHIFCSSTLGQGVNNGEKLNDRIHQAICKSSLIIYLLSDAFLHSSYCMEELGVGWFFALNHKKKCFYIRLPDIELSELVGFVNSKIDRFSLINVQDDIILLIENVCNVISVKIDRASIISNYATSFISAISTECQQMIARKARQKEERDTLRLQLEEARAQLTKNGHIIESYKQAAQIQELEKKYNLLDHELKVIESNFSGLGIGRVICKETILVEKYFFTNMVNRYEKLLQLLHREPDSEGMEKLVVQCYLACGNVRKAYDHFLFAIKLCDYMTANDIKFFIEAYDKPLKEIISMFTEKLNALPEGLGRDFISGALKYLVDVEKERKAQRSMNKPGKASTQQ